MIITCTKCNLQKEDTEFSFNKLKGKHASWCKLCYREHNNSVYKDKSSGRKEKVASVGHKKRFENRSYIYGVLKKSKCVRCGESDPYVLEFHHLRDKKYLISCMVSCSIQAIQEEIDKCEILCANCHRRETAIQQGWYSDIDKDNDIIQKEWIST